RQRDLLDKGGRGGAGRVAAGRGPVQPRMRLSVDAAIPYRYAPMSNRLIQVGADRLTLNAAGDTIADHDGARRFPYDAAGHLSAVYDHHHWIATYRYNEPPRGSRRLFGLSHAATAA
ncbi:MAG TPA: hypothetical protein PLO69_15055, partial [Gammaproteobacteria bacterium]|nr:hypothetical protein [Gammaproteobacteria bacterium]